MIRSSSKHGRVWQLQEAKNKLSEVVDAATREGPQVISRRGVDTAVLVALRDYARLVSRESGNIVDFFRNSPLAKSGIDLSRAKDLGRDVDL